MPRIAVHVISLHGLGVAAFLPHGHVSRDPFTRRPISLVCVVVTMVEVVLFLAVSFS
jgi:hypothetical protein